MISWGGCQAAECEYDVKSLAPTEAELATGLEDLSYRVPGAPRSADTQFLVTGHNRCGKSYACEPLLPAPVLEGRCPAPISASWGALVDKCPGHEDRACPTLELECQDSTGAWKAVAGCNGPSRKCEVPEQDLMKSHGLNAGDVAVCRTRACKVTSPAVTHQLSDPQRPVLARPNMGWYEDAVVVDWLRADARLFCDRGPGTEYREEEALGEASTAFHGTCGKTYTCYL